MEKSESEKLLPQLFCILHRNMSHIAPTDCSYEEDQKVWLSYITPELDKQRVKIVLMYVGENLAGYFQYRVTEDTMEVDEIEIKPEYQRTMVFYRFGQFMIDQMLDDVKYLTSYVHKENHYSQSIHESLGMECVGENKSGTSWFYRGEAAKIAAHFLRK